MAVFQAMVLVGCGGGNGTSGAVDVPATVAISPDVYVFKADLGGWKPNNGRWYSYPVSDQVCDLDVWYATSAISLASCFRFLTSGEGAAGQWVRSDGPWWVDPNHMQVPGGHGFGYLHVLAFTQMPAGYRSGTSLDDTEVSFTARIDEHFSTVLADSREGRRQGHVYLWFQTYPRPIARCTPDPQIGENCTRQSDYILTGGWDPAFEIDHLKPGQAGDFHFNLSAAQADQWTCLDHGVNVKYDCMGLPEALREVTAVGFVIAPVPPCPTVADETGQQRCDVQRIALAPAAHMAVGRFEVRGFSIRKRQPRPSEAVRFSFALRPAGDSAVPAQWSAPQYAAGQRMREGSGLQWKIGRAHV